MINQFRVISMVEGFSFLLLLFVAMPAKYYLGYPQAVTVAGWAHGLLFMAYVFMSTNLAQRMGWSAGFQILVVIAGMVPFGCLWLERRLKRDAMAAAA